MRMPSSRTLEGIFEGEELRFTANGSHRPRPSSAAGNCRHLFGALGVFAALFSVSSHALAAQNASVQRSAEVTIQGKVLNSTGRPVGDASLRLEREGVPVRLETKTNAAGVFVFSAPGTGRYFLIAEKSGLSSRTIPVVVSSLGEHKQVDVVLEDSQEVHTDSTASVPPSTQAMEFADKLHGTTSEFSAEKQ